MPILTQKAIESYKTITDRTIYKARFKAGDMYYETPIQRRERMEDGRFALYFTIVPGTGGTVNVTEVQLIDTDNEPWASKDEDIVIGGIQEGVLYRFTFDFREV